MAATLHIDAYTTVGSDIFAVPAGVTSVDVLVVAGGGAGYAGGGGAGGLIFYEGYSVTPEDEISLSVGNGGTDASGGNSTFGTLTAIGGGRGGGWGSPYTGSNGGSGGGAGNGSGNGGSGTTNQGNAGGNGNYWKQSAGGGGYYAVGSNGSDSTGGNGGIGKYFGNIFGTDYGVSGWFAGGGGGWGNITKGSGGQGGGGDSGIKSDATKTNGTNGTTNTGGGGGGSNATPGSGGSGIVLIRYITETDTKRTTKGKLLYKDFYNYAYSTNSNYTTHFGADETALAFNYTNRRVEDTSTGGEITGGIYKNTTYKNLYMRTTTKMLSGVNNSDWMGLGFRRNNNSGAWYGSSSSLYIATIRKDGTINFYKSIRGTPTLLEGTDAGTFVPTTAEFDFVIIANEDSFEILCDGSSKLTDTDVSITSAGYVEMIANSGVSACFKDLCICSSPDISCSKLPSGYKLKVYDRDSNTGIATESGGTATVDGRTLMYPANKVEILNGSDTVVDTYEITGDIWGGDVFEYTATPAMGILSATFV